VSAAVPPLPRVLLGHLSHSALLEQFSRRGIIDVTISASDGDGDGSGDMPAKVVKRRKLDGAGDTQASARAHGGDNGVNLRDTCTTLRIPSLGATVSLSNAVCTHIEARDRFARALITEVVLSLLVPLSANSH
jgi:hypothetical protein